MFNGIYARPKLAIGILLAYIADNYRMTGTIPFPIRLFVRIHKKDALSMHKPRRQAMPDFKFNEQILEEGEVLEHIQ